jgi:uracil DNA glycosylase
MTVEVNKPDIDHSWYEVLKEEFHSEYFQSLKAFLISEKKLHRIFLRETSYSMHLIKRLSIR